MLFDTQVILYMGYARDAFGDVLCAATLIPVRDSASKRHFGARDSDFDVRRVNAPVVCQAVVHIFADAIAGAGIVARPATPLVLLPAPHSFFITEPGRNFI